MSRPPCCFQEVRTEIDARQNTAVPSSQSNDGISTEEQQTGDPLAQGKPGNGRRKTHGRGVDDGQTAIESSKLDASSAPPGDEQTGGDGGSAGGPGSSVESGKTDGAESGESEAEGAPCGTDDTQSSEDLPLASLRLDGETRPDGHDRPGEDSGGGARDRGRAGSVAGGEAGEEGAGGGTSADQATTTDVLRAESPASTAQAERADKTSVPTNEATDADTPAAPTGQLDGLSPTSADGGLTGHDADITGPLRATPAEAAPAVQGLTEIDSVGERESTRGPDDDCAADVGSGEARGEMGGGGQAGVDASRGGWSGAGRGAAGERTGTSRPEDEQPTAEEDTSLLRYMTGVRTRKLYNVCMTCTRRVDTDFHRSLYAGCTRMCMYLFIYLKHNTGQYRRSKTLFSCAIMNKNTNYYQSNIMRSESFLKTDNSD